VDIKLECLLVWYWQNEELLHY